MHLPLQCTVAACLGMFLSVPLACSGASRSAVGPTKLRSRAIPKAQGSSPRNRRLDEYYIPPEHLMRMANSSIRFHSCHEGVQDDFYEDDDAQEREEEEGDWAEDVKEYEGNANTLFGAGGTKRGRGRQRTLEQEEENRDVDHEPSPVTKRFVTFQTCVNSPTCSDDTCGDKTTTTIDMDIYLEMTIEHLLEKQELNCQKCNECTELMMELESSENAEEIVSMKDRSKRMCANIYSSMCYAECQKIENMEDNGYLDAAEFVECHMLEGKDGDGDGRETVYVGATCASSGTRIKIGVFTDEHCTFQDASKDIEDYLYNGDGDNMKLSYQLLKHTFPEDECVVAACSDGVAEAWEGHNEDEEESTGGVFEVDTGGGGMAEQDDDEMELPEIKPVCENLYFAAAFNGEIEDYTYHDVHGDQDGDWGVNTPCSNGFYGAFCEFVVEDEEEEDVEYQGEDLVNDTGFFYGDGDDDVNDVSDYDWIVDSYLQVVSPSRLTKEGGLDHRMALFGPSTFSGNSSITANVYYADSHLCDRFLDTSIGDSPFILMADRGGCTLITKARNAQNAGALALIIADHVCMCDAGDACVPVEPKDECAMSWPIVRDDGSGSDITIPSFLLPKQDTDAIKAEISANNDVTMVSLAQSFPQRDSEAIQNVNASGSTSDVPASVPNGNPPSGSTPAVPAPVPNGNTASSTTVTASPAPSSVPSPVPSSSVTPTRVNDRSDWPTETAGTSSDSYCIIPRILLLLLVAVVPLGMSGL